MIFCESLLALRMIFELVGVVEPEVPVLCFENDAG